MAAAEAQRVGGGSRRPQRLILFGVAILVIAGIAAIVLSQGHTAKTAKDKAKSAVRVVTANSPLDISTPVDMQDGFAHSSAIVLQGDARFEVLSPTLIRLEYSPTANFENAPTVNALNRRMPVPKYTDSVTGGWLTVRTSAVTLRYKVGSGPFNPDNTSMTFLDGSSQSTVHPAWDWECPFGQTCQAGAAVMAGGAAIGQEQTGYESTAGYAGEMIFKGASATWTILGAPGGQAELSFRYSNVQNILGPPGSHSMDLLVDGHLVTTLRAAATESASPWSTLSATASLTPGSNTVEVLCGRANSCDVEFDTLSVAPTGAPVPELLQTNPLGGWIRGFDTFTYPPNNVICAPGTEGASCQNTLQPLTTDGLLDRAGWRLLDDTQSAVWTRSGWVQPRATGGDLEDGYLFAYGQNYAGALHTFVQLTGPAPLLPRSLFGVWYSDYTPYSSAYIEDSLYPEFQRNNVPLNTLSLDTDWKAPNSWDGWEWNPLLFPDPSGFLKWAGSLGIKVTLNIHSSIADNDPKLPEAEHIAKSSLASSTCTYGACKIWDWSSKPQAESNFALQEGLQHQGVAFFWLDWCCDDSVVTMPGLTPDAWIDHLYAQQMVNQGERGFVLARIGSSNGDPQQVYPAGPWSDHTSVIAFTGDAWGTWTQLAAEVALTPDEATIGEPYVSDDIGSYLGLPPSQMAQDTPDLYDRWVQFGTFQPILRLHSDNENRLPWEFPEPVSGITESFLRLREALIPYTYTLAADAHQDGMPIAQPLYLDYPAQSSAYTHPEEYLYGSNVLVAPVTTPGDEADATVWFPPGRWIDYFTGATFSGPATVSISEPLDRMPVFVRAGGIIPEQTSTSSSVSSSQLTLKVYSGRSGNFSLYGDSGSGLGYTKGQYTETLINDSSGTGQDGQDTTWRLNIGAAAGNYPGEPKQAAYRIEMIDTTDPSKVTLNGHQLAKQTPGSSGTGWYYDSSTNSVVIATSSESTSRSVSIVMSGTRPTSRPEPAAS